jgi:hypothetical protein
MGDPLIGLESAIITLVSQANRPLKARAIAVLLSDGKTFALHKRDVNPTLYRMLSKGHLCRDSEFRWSVRLGSFAVAHSSDEKPSVQPEKHLESPVGLADARAAAELHSAPNNCGKTANADLSSTRIADAEKVLEETSQQSPDDRVIGNLHIREEMRPYERHCTWCSRTIPEREMVLVVDGARQGRPRFCSEDCFQNWESLYWQRLAISHLGLTVKELRQEQKDLRLQRRFSRFR